jgi:pyruvate,orthophosphate dikinase
VDERPGHRVRRIYDIPDHIGTAVNVQMMVFATRVSDQEPASAARATATGAKEFYGEFSSTRRAKTSSPASARPADSRAQQVMPKAYATPRHHHAAGRHYRTSRISSSRFRTNGSSCSRRGQKRTGYAAVVIATDLVSENSSRLKEALLVDPEALNQRWRPGSTPMSGRRFP